VFRKITRRKGKNGCSIKRLAISKNISASGAHNAIYDCEILEKLVRQFKITNRMLLESAMLSPRKLHARKQKTELSTKTLAP
jgi:hypothetical protein